MKQFRNVLKFELGNYFKNKSFMMVTVLIAVILMGVIIVPTLIPGLLSKKGDTQSKPEDKELAVLALADPEQVLTDASLLTGKVAGEWKIMDSEEAVRQAVEKGEAKAGFVLKSLTEYTYVVINNAMVDKTEPQFQEALRRLNVQTYLEEKGLTADDAQALENIQITGDTAVLGKDSSRNYTSTYILIFGLYFLILFYGQMIAVSVTTEKSNRAIEILVTSVSPNSLIFGKVLAGALASILQVLIILGGSFAAYSAVRGSWGGMLDVIFDIPGSTLAAFAAFGLLGYLLYAFIYGALGALVSKTEDISKSSSLITIIYVASFFIAIFGMMDSDSMMMKVASFIPFTSSNAMFIRVTMGSVAWWEVGISLVILAASTAIVGVFAAKLFRFGTLMYGNPIKLSTALKKLRQQA